jgi:hypothetical protein
MEILLPIVFLLIILSFCLRFLLGERIYEHVAAKFVYDIIKGLILLPFRICAGLFRLMRFR